VARCDWSAEMTSLQVTSLTLNTMGYIEYHADTMWIPRPTAFVKFYCLFHCRREVLFVGTRGSYDDRYCPAKQHRVNLYDDGLAQCVRTEDIVWSIYEVAT